MIHAYITGVAPAAPPPAYYLAPLTGLAAGVSEDSDGMDENFLEKRERREKRESWENVEFCGQQGVPYPAIK